MRNTFFCLVAVTLVMTCFACRPKSSPETASQPSTQPSAAEPASPWKIELRVSPEHPRMVQPVTFTVHIVDGAGKPVNDAKVSGLLTMKTMDMGKTEVKLESKGEGNYQGTLTEMDMAGPWDLAITAEQRDFHALKTFEVVVYE